MWASGYWARGYWTGSYWASPLTVGEPAPQPFSGSWERPTVREFPVITAKVNLRFDDVQFKGRGSVITNAKVHASLGMSMSAQGVRDESDEEIARIIMEFV